MYRKLSSDIYIYISNHMLKIIPEFYKTIMTQSNSGGCIIARGMVIVIFICIINIL